MAPPWKQKKKEGGYSGKYTSTFWGGILGNIQVHLERGILGTKSQNMVNWDFLTKFPTTPAESGFSTRTSYEYEYELNENKVQLTRIRDENGKFCSVHADCPNSVPYSPF